MALHRALRDSEFFVRDERGLATAEIVFWLAALIPALLNIVDLGAYVFQRMQVENAAQMGAQAAWARCATPPAGGCAGDAAILAAIDEAIQSTSLGAEVTRSGAIEEQYYCRNVEDMTLVANGTSTSCASGGAAGYYVGVTVTYPYAPLFSAVSVASLLEGDMTETAWTRVR